MRMKARHRIMLGLALAAAVTAASLTTAGATEKLDSFAGSCKLELTVYFTPPATNSQQELAIEDRGTGTCDGTLNGQEVSGARVQAYAAASEIDGSCMRAQTTKPGTGSLTFPDGTVIEFEFEFDFVGTEGSLTFRGERGGTASGHGTFLTQRTPPDITLQCAGEGAKEAPLDIALSTDSALVSAQPTDDGAAAPTATPSAGKKRLRVRVRPQTVDVGAPTRFKFRVTRAGGRPVRAARIRFAGKRARTGRKGRARIVATLNEEGSRTAKATKRGFKPGTTTVNARRSAGESASKFSGNCTLSGVVSFQPPMTNNPQPVESNAEAPGTCKGTFVDGRGRSHDLDDAPVTYRGIGRGEQQSCGSGTAEGAGSLAFEWGEIPFTFSERRVGPRVFLTLTGGAGGSADVNGGVSQSEDPVAIAQKCGGSGLDRVALDGELSAPDGISG
jgi:hypothetical protein